MVKTSRAINFCWQSERILTHRLAVPTYHFVHPKNANCWVFFWRKLVYIRIWLSHHNMLFDHFRQWAHVPTGFENKMHMIRWLNYYTVTAFKPFGNLFSCARIKLIFLQFDLVRARACCQTEHQFQLLLDSMMLDPLIHTKSAILCTTFDIHMLFLFLESQAPSDMNRYHTEQLCNMRCNSTAKLACLQV